MNQDRLCPELSSLMSRFSAQSATLHRLNPKTNLLDLIAQLNIPDALLPIISHIPIGKGMAGLAAQRREPVQICNLQTDASGQARPAAKLTGMEGAIAIPILVNNQLLGVLGIAKSSAYEFTDPQRRHLLQIAASIGAKWLDSAT